MSTQPLTVKVGDASGIHFRHETGFIPPNVAEQVKAFTYYKNKHRGVTRIFLVAGVEDYYPDFPDRPQSPVVVLIEWGKVRDEEGTAAHPYRRPLAEFLASVDRGRMQQFYPTPGMLKNEFQ